MKIAHLVKVSSDDNYGRFLREKIRTGDNIYLYVDRSSGHVLKMRVDVYSVKQSMRDGSLYVDEKVKANAGDDSNGYLDEKLNCIHPVIGSSNHTMGLFFISVALEVSDMSDVDSSGVIGGDLLVYDSGDSEYQPIAISVADLTDVSSDDGDAFLYATGSSTWSADSSYVVADLILEDAGMNITDTSSWTVGSGATAEKTDVDLTGDGVENSRAIKITYSGPAADAYVKQKAFLSPVEHVRVKGKARGDGGTGYPRVKLGASTTIWTGTTSNEWQEFDVWVSLASAQEYLYLYVLAGGAGDYAEFAEVFLYHYNDNFGTMADEVTLATTLQRNILLDGPDTTDDPIMAVRKTYGLGDMIAVKTSGNFLTHEDAIAAVNSFAGISVSSSMMSVPIGYDDGGGGGAYPILTFAGTLPEHAGDGSIDVDADVEVSVSVYLDIANTSYVNTDTISIIIVLSSNYGSYSDNDTVNVTCDTSKEMQVATTLFTGVERDNLTSLGVAVSLSDSSDAYIGVHAIDVAFEVSNYNAQYGELP